MLPSVLASPRPALALLVALAPAAAGQGGAGGGEAAGQPNAGTREAPEHARDDAGLPERVLRAVEEGRYEEARSLLDELLGARRLAEARAHFTADNPQDGLLAVDRALEHLPRDPAALLLRAEGSLMLARQVAAEGGGALFVEGAFQDALDAYRDVPVTGPDVAVRVLFGASRAAYALGRGEEALELARQGMEHVAGGAPTGSLDDPPERTWAEAAFLAYRDARAAEAPPDDARALFLETRDALERLLARAPEDPWVWTQLARLDQWEGRLEEATAQLHRGLDHVPDGAGMLQVLVEVATARGGAAGALAELDAFLSRHPSAALGYWYRGRVRFDEALSALLEGGAETEPFRAAEADFVRCREIEPEHTASCQGYEVMCRNAVGWCHYDAGDLEAARDAFASMEDVFAGGLDWAMEGQLLSGVQGLELVAQAYNDSEDWAGAAAIFDVLREHRPDDVKWPNNAGFFHRDAAVPLELVGRRLCAAARGEPLPDELAVELARRHDDFQNTPEDCRRLAGSYLEAAREHMRRSYDAYLDAARLAPDDVRIVNDAALIAVYYLHEDLERAEAMLRRAIELGEQQLRNEELTEEERYDLENAFGDAHQNLGVLLLWQRGDREEARRHLERSLDLGDSRPLVRERLLPLCDATDQELAAAEEQGLRPWAVPCE